MGMINFLSLSSCVMLVAFAYGRECQSKVLEKQASVATGSPILSQTHEAKEGLTIDFVNPLIGTASRRKDVSNAASMQPFAGVPFGMWQGTIMTQLSELGRVSYVDSSSNFIGFIQTRQPAPWMGEYGQISVMPQVGKLDCDYQSRGVAFDKTECVFTPECNKIVLRNGIVGEQTGTSRTAMYRFTFPAGECGRLIFDASREFTGRISDTNAMPGSIVIVNEKLLTAWNEDRADAKLGPPLKNCRAHFRVELSQPFLRCGTYESGEERGEGGYRKMVENAGRLSVTGDVCGAWLEFKPSGEPLIVKISQSMIDDDQAFGTMRRETGDHFDFDRVRAFARDAWERQIKRIEIDADDDIKRIFYTGLYRAMQFPREFGEYGRYYSAFDDKVHSGDSYTSFSLWDTFRAEHALLTLVAPERVDGMVTALLQMYKEGGWLPKWPNPSYTGIMVGGPAEIMIAQAFVCGFRGFDLKLAYEAVKHNATVPSTSDGRVKWTGRELWAGAPEGRGGLTSYQTLGYVAADMTAESVSRTQDFGHADRAAAVLAEAVGENGDAEYFRKRSSNYHNLWNAERRMFLPRFADGTWKQTPKCHALDGDYTEQSAETAVWNVPYDVPGLVALAGGKKCLERMLDGYFVHQFFGGRTDGLTYHENETTHHIAYLYAALGQYDKCAETVRRILTTGYSAELWGMEGNDDCGQMSAWYVLSALGFYPLDPTTGEYVIGFPLIRSAVLHIDRPYKPTTFTIRVANPDSQRRHVKSVRLNGVELENRHLRHIDIVSGGTLEFELK